MLRKLLVSCLLGAVGLSMSGAEDGSVTFTYANDGFSVWGKSKSEIYDVAIRIEDPALVGKRITGIRALVNAYEGLESTSLWLSKELTLEKEGSVKVTVPDVYSGEAVPVKADIPGLDHSIGQMSVSLDAPYELTDEGIYVGYSLTVPAVANGVSLTDGQKYPVILSPCENPLSLYMRASKDFLKWLPYNDRLGAAAAIYVTLEGDVAEYSVGIKELSNAKAAVNQDFTVNAKLANIGAVSVSSIDYSYSIAGRELEGSLEFTVPVAPSLSGEVSVALPIEKMTERGDFDLNVTIDKVNGQNNDNILASASCRVSVLPFVPVHRPLLEEFTGTWCGWCPRGYIALELLNEEYGDNVVLAAYHDGDPMQAMDFPVNPDLIDYPSATLNRGEAEDPYLGKGSKGFAMKSEVKSSIEESVLADIQVNAHWADEEKTRIAVTANAIFLEDKENAGYKVGFLLISDGLSGRGSGWIQSNYFTGQQGYNGTELEVLTAWPSKVANLVFNDVVVDTDGLKGVPGSIPDNVLYNESYTTSFDYDIAGNAVIQDKDKLTVAAFIINPDGTVLNANKVKVGNTSAVDSLDFDAAVEVSAEYYDISGSRISSPCNGICVKVIEMSDGSFRTQKIVNKF